VDCGCEIEYEHKLVLATASNAALANSFDFSINGEDSRDEAQTELEYTHTTFTGTQLYGEIEFTIPRAEINALKRSDHLLQVLLNDGLLYRVTLTFDGPDTLSDLEIGDNTHSIELLGGNTIGTVGPGGGSNLVKINQSFTIPASGGVTVVVGPADAFADGQAESVVLHGINGILSRSTEVYTFTRSETGTPKTIPAGSLIGIASQDPRLTIDGITARINASNLALGQTTQKFGRGRYFFSLKSANGKVLAFFSRIGILWANAIESPNGFFGAITAGQYRGIGNGRFLMRINDLAGKTLLAIDRIGRIVVRVPAIRAIDSEIRLTSGRHPFLLRGASGILFGIGKQGQILYRHGELERSLYSGACRLNNEVFFIKEENGRYGVYRLKNGIEEEIYSVGNNFALTQSAQDIGWASLQDGRVEYFFWNSALGVSSLSKEQEMLSADFWHITVNGQSLAVGTGGFHQNVTPLAYQRSFKLLDSGSSPLYDGSGDSLSLAPLSSPLRTFGTASSQPYPDNIYGETSAEGMIRELERIVASQTKLYCEVTGQGGQFYSVIKKNGTGNAYASAIYSATAHKQLAPADKIRIPAMLFIHGESDFDKPTYKTDIIEHKNNIQEFASMFGQSSSIPLLITQQSGLPTTGELPLSAELQRQAGEEDNITVVEPTYQYKCADVVHPDLHSKRRRGIKLAQVFYIVGVRGAQWKPVTPENVNVNGQVITIDFSVPFPPLRFDRHINQPTNIWLNGISQTNPWINGKGFEVFDGSTALNIASVAITGSKQIQITVSSGNPTRILYANHQNWSGVGNVTQGPQFSGRRGSLMDSDPYEGWDRKTIAVSAMLGSNVITPIMTNGLADVGFYDRAISDFLPSDAIVMTKTAQGNSATLSDSWGGTTGTHEIDFVAPQNNYCLIFDWSI
jgi:hypothetical protein